MDGFGQPLPTFNIKGETKVKTAQGGVVTALLCFMVLTYAILKFIQLTGRENPDISETKVPEYYSISDAISFSEVGFKAAFTLESYQEGYTVNDPRYIKWIARSYTKKDGKSSETLHPISKCSAEKLSQFSPVAQKSRDKFKKITEDENRGLYCVNPVEDLVVQGEKSNDDYTRVEILFVPCNYIHSHLGYTEDFVSPECIADLDK